MDMENTEFRIKSETSEETKISSLIETIIENQGYLIVQVKINQHEKILQIMLEKINAELNIDDCKKISRSIMPIIDLNNVLPEEYRIEISSPGVDRLLVRPKDFLENIGNEIKIELLENIENKKKYKGMIEGFAKNILNLKAVKIDNDVESYKEIKIPITIINKAKLILNDNLFK